MSSKQKFVTNSYCPGGRHLSGTTNIYGAMTSNGSKYLGGQCNLCGRNKSMFVSDKVIAAEGLGDFFKSIGKIGKKLGKNILKNPEAALQLGMTIGQAAASKNPAASKGAIGPGMKLIGGKGLNPAVLAGAPGPGKKRVGGKGLYLNPA